MGAFGQGRWPVRRVLFNCTARLPRLEDMQPAPVRRAGLQHRGHARPPPPTLSQRWMLRSAKWEGCWVRGVGWKPKETGVQMIGLQWPWAMDCEPLVPALWASQAPQGPPSSLKTLLVVTGQSSTPAPLQDLKREKTAQKEIFSERAPPLGMKCLKSQCAQLAALSAFPKAERTHSAKVSLSLRISSNGSHSVC